MAEPYVFLSYASQDRAHAAQLVQQLESTGVAVWIDRAAIAPGMTWSGEIVRGIQGCAALIVLCSKAAMASANVQRELQLAMEESRPLLPLMLEPVTQTADVRYILAGRQTIELGDRTESQWLPQLMLALARLGIPSGAAERNPAARHSTDGLVSTGSTGLAARAGPLRTRRRVFGGIGAVAVVGLGLTGALISRHVGVARAVSFRGAGAGASPSSAAELSVYAGNGQAGHVNGPAGIAQFAGPWNVAVDRHGKLFVSDLGNNRIRLVAQTGIVSDFAGSGEVGDTDGPSGGARFSFIGAVSASGLAFTPDGALYVADSGNFRIRAVSADGTVSTLAGSGKQGFADGLGASAQFASFGGLAADSRGMLYASDTVNNRIRRITPQGVVSTVAGSAAPGYADGPGDLAQFDGPGAVAVNAAGDLFVVDRGNNFIRRIAADGVVRTFAGSGVKGFADGPAHAAQFNTPWAMAIDASDNLYVLEPSNRRIRKITPTGTVSTLFEFTNPDHKLSRLALDGSGNLYLPDVDHNVIYKLTVQHPG